MALRVPWIGIACLTAWLASVSASAEPAPTEAPPPPAAKPGIPSIGTGATPRRGGIGGQIGGSAFYGQEDYGTGALPRFDFEAHFRYVFTNRWRAQFSPGFTWSAYSDKEKPPMTDIHFPSETTKKRYLTLLTPMTLQAQFTWHIGQWLYHLGAGPGLYRVVVENHRKVLQDPITFRLHRGVYTGYSAELGAERFLKTLPSTSIELSIADHHAFVTRDDQFKGGWNSNLSGAGVRMGANYYFDVDRKKPPELPLNR